MESIRDLAAFSHSLQQPAPPAGLAPLVEALWWEAHGDWHRAHEIAQEIETGPQARNAAWVHAFLHRSEGDAANAAYWYRRAGQPVASVPLEQERCSIVAALLLQD
ncbi:hypothetical protein [Acidipila sp. EB88]|uniref:hypothetical protein n=1 Tax=Acidipila sp. EB88 TaxID=2305226 RepID=UPI000F5DF229|nr:hypothetical protein [Acidipila sp. EB88]RRA49201.1 hypothetical protein D1Y84_13895 [Acidipila sp. EB88]